jgi:signal transduction histidine kinase
MEAYEMGRQALESGKGVLDVVAAHREALAETLEEIEAPEEAAAAARNASALLLECLGPFEMTLRGYQIANEELRSMKNNLERQVDERTHELTESLEALGRVSGERRLLLGHLTSAHEEERRLIAEGLHDDTIQVMTAVGMRFSILKRRLDDAGTSEEVTDLERAVQEAITRCRNLLFALRPPSLEREGLVTALSELLRRLAGQGGFAFSIEGEREVEAPIPTRVLAYRIAQEALVNVRKHASATRVVVHLERADEGLLIRITDDGVGFDLDQQSESWRGHLGLSSMRERIDLAGGWLRIDSEADRGTTLEYWLPDIRQPDS